MLAYRHAGGILVHASTLFSYTAIHASSSHAAPRACEKTTIACRALPYLTRSVIKFVMSSSGRRPDPRCRLAADAGHFFSSVMPVTCSEWR